MKYIEAAAHVDPGEAPAFFNLLAHSSDVTEARVLEVNTAIEGVETFMFAIDGDASAFEAQAAETPGVEHVEVSETDRKWTYAIMVMRPMETPPFRAIHDAGPHAGFVILTPMIYRDGSMYGRAVGDPESLQGALADAPDSIEVRIDEIGRYRGARHDPVTTLSDR